MDFVLFGKMDEADCRRSIGCFWNSEGSGMHLGGTTVVGNRRFVVVVVAVGRNWNDRQRDRVIGEHTPHRIRP